MMSPVSNTCSTDIKFSTVKKLNSTLLVDLTKQTKVLSYIGNITGLPCEIHIKFIISMVPHMDPIALHPNLLTVKHPLSLLCFPLLIESNNHTSLLLSPRVTNKPRTTKAK